MFFNIFKKVDSWVCDKMMSSLVLTKECHKLIFLIISHQAKKII